MTTRLGSTRAMNWCAACWSTSGYKDAATELEQREILTRDVFVRASPPAEEAARAVFARFQSFESARRAQASHRPAAERQLLTKSPSIKLPCAKR